MTRKEIFQRTVAGVLGIFTLIYGADYLYLRVRMRRPSPNSPFESMTRARVLAIPQKNGKLDYQIDQTQPVETITCVHSLFPHFGDQPCWYLKPRLNKPIPVN